MIALSVSGLSFAYPTAVKSSLSNINFSVNQGEFVAVIGANNSGKTTLCYALSGVIPHFYQGRLTGTVKLREVETVQRSLAELAGMVGLVMQNPTSQFSGVRFTVFEEAAFGLENMGVDHDEIVDRVMHVLDLVDLVPFKDQSPFHLSGGQQQKLAFASMLAMSPEVLALDEPTTFLDPVGAQEIFVTLNKLRQKGKTIIIAEQRLEWIAEYADRVIALMDGEIILNGPPQLVLTREAIKEIGLDWMTYTKTAALALQSGQWSEKKALPVTFEETVAGLKNNE